MEKKTKKFIWPQGHNLRLTLDLLELIMETKKKVLGSFNGSFDTFTRYNVKT